MLRLEATHNTQFQLPLKGKRAHLSEVGRVAQHMHVQQLCHIPAAVCVVLFSERRPDGGAFFLDHLPFFCLRSCCPDGPDQLPESDGGWHILQKGGQGGNSQLVSARTALAISCVKQALKALGFCSQ